MYEVGLFACAQLLLVRVRGVRLEASLCVSMRRPRRPTMCQLFCASVFYTLWAWFCAMLSLTMLFCIVEHGGALLVGWLVVDQLAQVLVCLTRSAVL